MKAVLAGLLCLLAQPSLASLSDADTEAEFLQEAKSARQALEGAPKPRSQGESELVNLMEADFSQRPELRPFLDALDGTFQILLKADPGSLKGAHPPETEGGAGLSAECSASYLGGGRALTAEHCRWKAKKLEDLVLRRHRYELKGSRLARAGYDDYRVAAVRASSSQDLLEITLLEGGPPIPGASAFHLPASRESPAAGQAFQALGYPNDLYAVPHLAVGCRVLDHPARLYQYSNDCRIVPGMSGGPQFTEPGMVQIGVNSQPGAATGAAELLGR